jgi:cyclophilin family peptidyl-prolyl cis-trans isomerase
LQFYKQINDNQILNSMNIILRRTLIIPALLILISCNAPGGGNENTTVTIKTTAGDIKLKLYDNTPLHRDNFIKLVNMGFYEGVSFHRVIRDFMVQAGDPATKTGSKVSLPDSLTTYTIPAEINNQYFHKKGALAAARQGDEINPARRSSGTQFYIVQGVRLTDSDLDVSEQRINSNIKQSTFNSYLRETSDSIRSAGSTALDSKIQEIASIKMFNYLTSYKDHKITEDQRNIYKTLGGTPRLDGTYTIFGEVVEGLDVIDKIAGVSTDSNDKPLTDVKILKIKIEKK